MRRPASLGRHIVAVLVLAAAVFVAAVILIWLGLGGPHPRPDADFTTTNQLEIVKLALAVVAGVGGVVALVVAYQRQTVIATTITSAGNRNPANAGFGGDHGRR
jgi:hypothetical protein